MPIRTSTASRRPPRALAVNFEGAMNVTTAFLPLLADDATVVNVSSRQAARTLGFLEPRHRDVLKGDDVEAVRRAAYEVADLLDDDYGPSTTLATPAHGLSKCALNAWTRIMARSGLRCEAVARAARTRHNPVVWEGCLQPRQVSVGARVVVTRCTSMPYAGSAFLAALGGASAGRSALPAGRVRDARRRGGSRDARRAGGSLCAGGDRRRAPQRAPAAHGDALAARSRLSAKPREARAGWRRPSTRANEDGDERRALCAPFTCFLVATPSCARRFFRPREAARAAAGSQMRQIILSQL